MIYNYCKSNKFYIIKKLGGFVMKINYPVKYAVMPVIERNDWRTNYNVVCYIVSKCYLVNDSTKYKENGQSVKEYEVVFPYQLGPDNNWKRTNPSFDHFSGNCDNSNIVDSIYDSYEEALEDVTIKNEKLCEKTWAYLPFSGNYVKKIQEKKDEFSNRLAKYKMLEEQIFFHTNDLEIDKRKELDKVVSFKNNCGKILSCNLYEAIQLFDDTKFVVYTVTQKQYDNLVKFISEKEVENIESIIGHAEGLLVHEAKDSVIRIVNPNIDGVYYINEYELLNYSDKLNKVTQNDFENVDQDTYILYTTETVEDIMNSYKKYADIDLSKVQGPLLKKTRK
jgi:hypothetical protein